MSAAASRAVSIAMQRLLVAVPLAALLAGCGTTSLLRGSGNVVAQKRSVPSVDRIELRGSAEVVVTVGGPRAVTVRADDNIVPRIHTDVVGDVLVVSARAASPRAGSTPPPST